MGVEPWRCIVGMLVTLLVGKGCRSRVFLCVRACARVCISVFDTVCVCVCVCSPLAWKEGGSSLLPFFVHSFFHVCVCRLILVFLLAPSFL